MQYKTSQRKLSHMYKLSWLEYFGSLVKDSVFVYFSNIRLHSLLAISIIISGCQMDQTVDDEPITVEVKFAVNVGQESFECGQSYENLGATRSTVAFTDMRFYVYNVKLINDDGQSVALNLMQDEIWQNGMVALLDFEDGCENGNEALNASIIGQVPKGQYQGLEFSVGLPPELNSPETILEGRGSPLNLNAMFWSWRSGYKYLRLDTDLPFFRVHLGASACDDDFNCDDYNIASFSFDRFDHSSEQVLLDLDTLLSDSDLTQNAEGTPPGCMGQRDDPDCQKIYKHFNLGNGNTNAFSITSQ